MDKGFFYVMADYSHTDRKQLVRVVTRRLHRADAGSTDAEMALEELRAHEKALKHRYRGRKVYIVEIKEVLE